MAFTSFTYLYFLAIVVALYWIVRNRIAQNILLLVASYVFYGWLTPWYCILLAASTVITYGCLHVLWSTPEGQPKSRWPVAVAVLANIGMLVVLKYWNFWMDDIVSAAQSLGWSTSEQTLRLALPLGLSFYTLQAVGLIVDAYRGDVTRQSFLNVSVFLAFFPKLIAGPFEKAQEFLIQTTTIRAWSWDRWSSALPLLLMGFLKKLVVAENVGIYVAQIYVVKQPSLLLLVVGAVGFAIQILADFSGYTDIARGSARLMGFELMENFNKPYLAISPSDFWRRWHISLSKWFTNYVYIPLGGSRNGTAFTCAAFMVTMLVSGMWHGATANFAVWGMYWGVLLCVYHLLGKGGHWQPTTAIGKLFSWLLMCFWILCSWVIFWAPQWQFDKFRMFPKMQVTTTSAIFFCVFITYTLPWWIALFGESRTKNSWLPVRSICRGLSIVALLIFGAADPGAFIYFNF